MCWAFCCLRTKHDSTWVDTFIVKTVGLKPHLHWTQIFCIRQTLVFRAKRLENEWWDWCSLKRILPEIIKFFFLLLSSLFCWNRMNGIAGFSEVGRPPTLRKKKATFLRDSFVGRIVGRGLWPPRSPDPTSICRDLTKTFCCRHWSTNSWKSYKKNLWKAWMLVYNIFIFKKKQSKWFIALDCVLYGTYCMKRN